MNTQIRLRISLGRRRSGDSDAFRRNIAFSEAVFGVCVESGSLRGLDGRLRGWVRLRVSRRLCLTSRFVSAFASAAPTYIEADGVGDLANRTCLVAQLPFETPLMRGEGPISGRVARWLLSVLIILKISLCFETRYYLQVMFLAVGQTSLLDT